MITGREQQGGDGSGSEAVTRLWHLQLQRDGRGVTVDLQGDSRDGECGGAPTALHIWMNHDSYPSDIRSPLQATLFFSSVPLPELSSRNIHLSINKKHLQLLSAV